MHMDTNMINRRKFITTASAWTAFTLYSNATANAKPIVHFGMVTDIHYANIPEDKKPISVVGRRYYRESLRKLTEAVNVFNTRSLDFIIELGDFKDNTNGRDETLRHLEAIESAFAKFNGPRYHVAGNHDFDCITPTELFSRIPNNDKISDCGYYSFERGGVKFIVLNACYDSQMKMYSRANPWSDANVPPEEMEWLKRELTTAHDSVVVFCHQRLEDSAEKLHIVKNAPAVRAILEASGKVKAVITGHQHRGGYNVVNGIPYYSLRAMVCDSGEGNNSFAEVTVYDDGSFTVLGWRNAASCGERGEFPGRGLVARDTLINGAAMVSLNAVPQFTAFPAAGLLLSIKCKSDDKAIATAKEIRKAGRLAQTILMMESREQLLTLKNECPWVKTGFIICKPWTEQTAWEHIRDVVNIGVEFLQIPPNSHCSREQMTFLHDHAIRTICLVPCDEDAMRMRIEEGHDFIFPDNFNQMYPVYLQLQYKTGPYAI